MPKNGIPEWGSDLKAGLATVLSEIGGIKERLKKIEERVETLANRQWWMTGIGSTMLVVIPLLGFLLPYYIRGLVNDATTTAVANSLSRTESFSLDGELSKENMLSGASEEQSAIQFLWELQKRIDPKKLIAIRVQTRDPLPGVVKSAELGEGGSSCVMTLSGPIKTLTAIKLPLDATIMVDKRL